MEYAPVPNKKVMPSAPRMEPLILDHTAIALYKDCPRKYFFQIVLGFRERDTPVYFTFGSAYHLFREVLETSKDFKTGLGAALDYWDKVQGDDPHPEAKFSFMTRLRLMQSCTVAFRHWQHEKEVGKIEVLAVEQPFNVELVPGSGEFTSGRFDQIIRFNGRVWGRDFKTTSKDTKFYDRSLTPNDQFTRYTFAESLLKGERVRGQFIEVLYNAKETKSKSGGPEISTFLAERTDFEIDDWLNDEMFTRRTIKQSREEDRWPKNEKGCTFCQFHSVCKIGSENGQLSKLRAEYVQREWDNTKTGAV